MHLQANAYFIGLQKASCFLHGNQVMVRKGDGQETLAAYLERNTHRWERGLVLLMVKSEQSLEYVIEARVKKLSLFLRDDSRHSSITKTIESQTSVKSLKSDSPTKHRRSKSGIMVYEASPTKGPDIPPLRLNDMPSLDVPSPEKEIKKQTPRASEKPRLNMEDMNNSPRTSNMLEV